MKIQSISKQSFNGKLIFLNKDGAEKNIKLRAEVSRLGGKIREIKYTLKDKPYNIYVEEMDNKGYPLLNLRTDKFDKGGHEFYIAKSMSQHLQDTVNDIIKYKNTH